MGFDRVVMAVDDVSMEPYQHLREIMSYGFTTDATLHLCSSFHTGHMSRLHFRPQRTHPAGCRNLCRRRAIRLRPSSGYQHCARSEYC